MLCLLILCTSCAASPKREFKGSFTPKTNGERLLSLLVSLTNPEVLELRMDEEPDDQGNVRNIHFLVKGASIGGFRVEKLALEASFVELNAPSRWDPKAKDPIVVKSALRSNLEAVILEKDINAALSTYAGDEWNKVSVDLKPGIIGARGYFHVKNPGLTLLAEVQTGLEIRQGKELWLKNVNLKINHDEQTDAVRQAIRDIQPVVDIRDFPFPVTLAVLSLDDQKLRIATRTAPKPFEGILLRYVRGS
jgi:hypothetical protein